MAAYIQNIATAVPQHFFEQHLLRERMKQYISTKESSERIIHRIYSKSGIDKRHTVIDDFKASSSSQFFFKKDGSLRTPSTGERNELYVQEAKQLFVKTARKTIQDNDDISKDDISHIITVSCTGFFAPEPGFEIIQQLDLAPSTRRFHLGFMGCFAAFPAMKMAQSFCESNSDARVLVVCLELCTLHLQDSENTDQLISASVFADGAAGMIISSEASSATASLKINKFSSAIADESQDDMGWTIGDTGFEMVLSSYVPDIIESNLAEAIRPMLDDFNFTVNQIIHWAVHPGGRAILDKIQQSFELKDQQLRASRTILSEYGNMSSATILFVLAELLEDENIREAEPILTMAFGPGLTIESGLLTKVKQV